MVCRKYVVLTIFTLILQVLYVMSLSKFSIRQGINIPGLKVAFKLFTQPNLALPQIEIQHLSQLNAKKLKEWGVRGIVFDKDNTLSLAYVDEVHASVKPKVVEVKELFPTGISILSNSVGTSDDRNYQAAAKVEECMGIPVIRHQKKETRMS